MATAASISQQVKVFMNVANVLTRRNEVWYGLGGKGEKSKRTLCRLLIPPYIFFLCVCSKRMISYRGKDLPSFCAHSWLCPADGDPCSMVGSAKPDSCNGYVPALRHGILDRVLHQEQSQHSVCTTTLLLLDR